MGDEGLEILSSGKIFDNLEELNLASNNIGDLGVENFVTSPSYPNLKKLNLRRNCITLKGVKLICNSALPTQLEFINLDYNENMNKQAIHMYYNTFGERAF